MAPRIHHTSSQQSAAVALLLLTTFSAASPAAAFVPQPGTSRRTFVSRKNRGGSTAPPSSSSRLHGVIYYPDGSTEDDSSSSQSSSILFEESGVPTKRPAGLQSPAWNAPLARLAAKHAPSGGLDVTRIDEISIIGCTDRRCDIEAIVCEDDGCVSLSVPVALLNPCDQAGDDDGFDDCVMENLEQLDQNLESEFAASAAAAAAASPEDVMAHERMLAELHNEHTVKYPKWWNFPGGDGNLELAQQSESLLHILNEPDFAPEIMKLVMKHVIVDPGDNLFVGEAAVVAVGPAGLILRCSAMVRENDRAKLIEMIQVPLQFENLALTPETLRDAVLDMVEEGEMQA